MELSEAEWDRVVDTNLKAMFLTCKYVLPHMERQKSGAIVNISSMAAVRFAPYPMLPYSASKAGVNALTRSIAMQYAARGIRANAIMPGLIRTPMAIEGIVSALGIDKQELIRMRDARRAHAAHGRGVGRGLRGALPRIGRGEVRHRRRPTRRRRACRARAETRTGGVSTTKYTKGDEEKIKLE